MARSILLAQNFVLPFFPHGFFKVMLNRQSKGGTILIAYLALYKCSQEKEIMKKTTGSTSSLGIVNMKLHDSVIIRVCMGNVSIIWNSSK